MSIKIYDDWNNLKYEVVNNRVYDSRNNYVYEISGNRVYDTYGNWKFEVYNDRICDNFGHIIYELGIRNDGGYNIYDSYSNKIMEVRYNCNTSSSSPGLMGFSTGGSGDGVGMYILFGIIIVLFSIIGPISFMQLFGKSLSFNDNDDVLMVIFLLLYLVSFLFITKRGMKKIDIEKGLTDNYLYFLTMIIVYVGTLWGSVSLVIDLVFLSSIKGFGDVLMLYLGCYFLAGVYSALPVFAIVFVKYRVLAHREKKRRNR